MCGILGWIDPDAHSRRDDFEMALDIIKHRGPDDRGIVADDSSLLGHRRLSILDIGPAGHQPMLDVESGACIVFNGEIYNYIEIRQQLEKSGHRFVTQTDTEVLLRSHIQWGDGCVTRLNGMWSFAIWLPLEQRVFFSRDRFGKKPFYYINNNTFAFASEPKALLSLFPKFREVNKKTLYRFLAEGLLYTDVNAFYEGVKLLPPAHSGEYKAGDSVPRIWQYWDYPNTLTEEEDPQNSAEEFAELFDDAVRIRLRSDVPVGISLSGGLDSTAVLASSMNSASTSRTCFTSVYSNSERGEAPWARLAASPYAIRPVEVEAQQDDWIETHKMISWHMDAPGYSPAVYALWYLMKDARQRGVPVLLEGQGADEALGGYPQYGAIDIIKKMKSAIHHPTPGRFQTVSETWRGLAKTFTNKWVLRWLIREMMPFLVTINRRRIGAMSVLRPEFRSLSAESAVPYTDSPPDSMDSVTSRLWQDHAKDILPGLLHYGDAISMAHSIESRLPFMDYRLVEWLFKRDCSIKIRQGSTKWVLREYLAKADQMAIAKRQDKLGYPTPVDKWLADDGGAIPKQLLLAEGARVHEYCDPTAIAKLIKYHSDGGSGAGNHIYRLISTEMWMRSCIDVPPA